MLYGGIVIAALMVNNQFGYHVHGEYFSISYYHIRLVFCHSDLHPVAYVK